MPNRLALVLLGIALSLAPKTRAQGAIHDSLVALAHDMTFSTARVFPLQATAWGIPGFDAEIETPSEAYRAAYIKRLNGWKARLKAVTARFDAHTSLLDRDDATLLGAQLAAQINSLLVYQTDRKDYAGAANRVLNALLIQLLNLPVAGREGATPAAVAQAWSDIVDGSARRPHTLPGDQDPVDAASKWRLGGIVAQVDRVPPLPPLRPRAMKLRVACRGTKALQQERCRAVAVIDRCPIRKSSPSSP